jgi:metal-sulfur cluster biosynthetic enzyme
MFLVLNLLKEFEKVIFVEDSENKITKKQVLDALSEVYDPEIPINIVDLGLVYEVKLEEKKINVFMTVTSPHCPMGQFIVSMAEEKLKEKFSDAEVVVKLTFSPPWTPDRIKKAAKEKLNL